MRWRTLVTVLFWVGGIVHLLFGVAGTCAPRWFYATVPLWPPLHVGQIQIAGVFDLTMATAFLWATRDVERYAGLAIPVGIVAEVGHALVRLGHIALGDNPSADWSLPGQMLAFACILAAVGVQLHRRAAPPRA